MSSLAHYSMVRVCMSYISCADQESVAVSKAAPAAGTPRSSGPNPSAAGEAPTQGGTSPNRPERQAAAGDIDAADQQSDVNKDSTSTGWCTRGHMHGATIGDGMTVTGSPQPLETTLESVYRSQKGTEG